MGIFKPATRKKCRLRMAIDGVSGGGKSFSALRFGMRIAQAFGGRVAFISSEPGAAEKYLGHKPDGIPFEFDILELDNFSPTSYRDAIFAAGREGYSVAIIDSLSHAWNGSGGALELKDKQADREKGNSFTAWRTVTPLHNQMIEAILRSPCHIIATMRTKTEYVFEPDAKGKLSPRKVGLEPIQRAGMEYEFDLYGSIDEDHTLRISKSRCNDPSIVDATVIKPGANWIEPVIAWLNEGIEPGPEVFAVTEEDLAKFEKTSAAPASGSSAASKPSVADMLAAAAPAPSPAAEPAKIEAPSLVAPAPAATAPAVEFLTKDQTAELRKLVAALKLSEDQVSGILKKRACQAVEHLTKEQAAEIIEKLREKLPKASDPAIAGVSTSGVNEFSVREDAPCFPAQLSKIQDLLLEVEQVTPGTTAKVLDFLKASERATLSALTITEATELIKALEAKELEKFFTTPF